ncbi:MAG: type II and III secretion system protein, partial [Planctomycetota bacterium]|nr:type II and III secretion system protein [Planctomycetota bacterium]
AVGIMLNVRPQITVEKDVDLEINLELSSIVPGQVLFGGFIVDRRETTTQIIVKNGQTIVLSGILRDTESQITRKIPILGDIPLLGELFTSRETAKSRTELLVFITPVVVDNPSENDTNFNVGERQRLEELTRPLKEQARSREPVGSHLLHKQFERTEQTSPQATDFDAGELNEE